MSRLIRAYIHWPKYLKEHMIFFQRHYCNICPVQRPLIRSPVAKTVPYFCSILKKHWSLRQQDFNKTDTLLIKMDQNLQFLNFLKLRLFFWKSINHSKRGFRVIISIRWPYKTFPFIDKTGNFDFGKKFKGFLLFWKLSFFAPFFFFYKTQTIDFSRMTTGSKFEQSVTSIIYRTFLYLKI